MRLRSVKRLLRQSWGPALIALAYATWDILSTDNATTRRFIEKCAAGFFFVMWFVAQFLRARKQVEDEDQSNVISGMDAKLNTLLQRATLQSGTQKAEETTKTETELRAEYDERHLQFAQISASASIEEQMETARRYTAVAEELADRQLDKAQQIPVMVDKLTVAELRRLHRAIFPPGYKLGGVLRMVAVSISPMGSTTLTPGTLATSDVTEIPKMLEDLLEWWNRSFGSLMSESPAKKIAVIAEFHHRFSVIHPFLDGNGRLIRILLRDQIRALFGNEITIDSMADAPEYRAALRAADGGDLEPLGRFLLGLLGKMEPNDAPLSGGI